MTTATDKRPGFFMIGNAVVDAADLGPYEMAVYIFIVRHVNGKSGVAFPSTQTIADRTHMSKPKAIECIATLETKGLISVNRRYDETGKGREVSHYYVENYIGVVNQNNHTGKPEQLGVVNEVYYNNTDSNNTEQEKIHAPATQDAPSPKVKKAPHPIHQRNAEGQNPYFNAICYFCWGTPYLEWTEADKTARSKGKGGGRVGKILAQLQLDYDALGGFTSEQFEAALKAWAIDNHTTPVHMRPRDAGKFHDAIAPLLKAIVSTERQKIVTLPTENTPSTDWREHARLAQLRKENN